MSDNLDHRTGDTVRILRPPPRVFTELNGRNVWMGDVEPLELALDEPVNTDPYNNVEVTRHSLLPTQEHQNADSGVEPRR